MEKNKYYRMMENVGETYLQPTQSTSWFTKIGISKYRLSEVTMFLISLLLILVEIMHGFLFHPYIVYPVVILGLICSWKVIPRTIYRIVSTPLVYGILAFFISLICVPIIGLSRKITKLREKRKSVQLQSDSTLSES